MSDLVVTEAFGDKLDKAIINEALTGSQTALMRVVNGLTPVVQARVARCLLRSSRSPSRDVRQDVKDLTQEVFLHLFENNSKVLRSWSPERGMSLENFVGLIAERRTISTLRSGRRTAWREDETYDETSAAPDREPGPEQASESGDLWQQLLYRLHEELSPLGWRLFELLYVAEKSVEEVRSETGMSPDAIYAWRSRLRRMARERYAELDGLDAPDTLGA